MSRSDTKKRSQSNRRPKGARTLNVSGDIYFWRVAGRETTAVWDQFGKRHSVENWRLCVYPDRDAYLRDVNHDWDDGGGVPITPGQVAAWISANIRIDRNGRPLPEPVPVLPKGKSARRLAERSSRAAKPTHLIRQIDAPDVPVTAICPGQPEIYLVIGESGEYEEYSTWVEAAHADPEAARQHADGLSAWWIRLAELSRIYYAKLESASLEAKREPWCGEFDREKFNRRFFSKECRIIDPRWQKEVIRGSCCTPRFKAVTQNLLVPGEKQVMSAQRASCGFR